ncbi:MAG: alpha/beta hydrolase [Myxococcales bacterium]|nr:alpha/beta hydrolase [Myxococcales bacterium]HIL80370.1 alpha/beta hydrolase [Myxococcales bacterium]
MGVNAIRPDHSSEAIAKRAASSLRQALLSVLLIALALSSCSEHQELRQNNDPDRYTVVEDVLWGSPAGFDLSMDIYTPKSGKDAYPVVVMFHGGGWLVNDKSIMHQASAYLATHGEYVICNVDYRLLADNNNSVTLNQIVDDAFGAVLWVKDHIGNYGGDGGRIAVTGDSAGGHLSAMIVNLGDRLSSAPFSQTSPNFQPSYLPAGTTAEEVAEQGGLGVQAAILSYGAFDVYQGAVDGFESLRNPFWLVSGSLPRGLFGNDQNVTEHPELYRALSPAHNIPHASERLLPPQLLTVGTDDPVTTPASVQAYFQKLELAGHPVSYWEYDGRSHAFLDSGSNRILGNSFEADAPEALDVMIRFLDGVFASASGTF